MSTDAPAPHLEHREDCDRPSPATEPSAEHAETAPVSAYRCGAHLAVAVTWRGTGCGLCHDERAAARKARAAARKARATTKHTARHTRQEEGYQP